MRDFINEVPIDDEMVVLDLLYRRWNDSTDRVLHRKFRGRDRPSYVRVEHVHDFSEGTRTDFLVTEGVIDRLLARHHIEGKPRWGYRDEHELIITQAGIMAFDDTVKRVNWSYDWWASSEHWYRATSRQPWAV